MCCSHRPTLPFSFLASLPSSLCFCFFFFNDTATTEIYTLSLHDALPILGLLLRVLQVRGVVARRQVRLGEGRVEAPAGREREDRKSTRLNSSHSQISYAVFCLKKKKKEKIAV